MATRKPRQVVVMFQERFSGLVEAELKLQTVRPRRRDEPVHVGDRLSLRAWSGKPYRSKQRIIRETVCSAVTPIWLNVHGALWLNDGPESQDSAQAFARADGFSSFPEMFWWFANTHGLPFSGVVIRWEKGGAPCK